MELKKEYVPCSIHEFIGNKTQVHAAKESLKKPGITGIFGPHGVGKTTLVKLILDELQSEVLDIEENNLHTIENFVKNRTIQNKSHKIIFVDDLNDIKQLEKWKNFTCVFTSSMMSYKSHNINAIYLTVPSVRDVLTYFLSKNLNIADDVLLKYIKESNCNMRDIFLCLDNYNKSIRSKFRNMNVFDISKFIMQNSKQCLTRDDSENENIDTHVSHLMYGNMLDEIYFNFSTNLISTYSQINDACSVYYPFDETTKTYLRISTIKTAMSQLTSKPNQKYIKYMFMRKN